MLEADPDVRWLTAALLRQLGYGVMESEYAEGAIAYSDEAPADLLAAENSLPAPWRGGALAARMRRAAPNLWAILTSGIGLGAAAASFGLLLKPFGLDELSAFAKPDRPVGGPYGCRTAKAPGQAIPLPVRARGRSAAIVP